MIWCMRTTITLDDGLLREAKAVAAASGRPLKEIIENALRESLARRKNVTSERVILNTFGGSGLQPGVDIHNSAALLDIMERDAPA